MGSSLVDSGSCQSEIMKILLVVSALLSLAVGAPEAEANAEAVADPSADPSADPWYHYGYGHRPYGYASYYRPYGHYGYGLWGRKKREAEAAPVADPTANPEADPWYYYSHGYGHGYGYARYYRPYGHYGYGAWGRKKREAEATPAA